MSLRNSIHSANYNGFSGNGTFEPNFDDMARALDSTYTPGILETEMMSNRSSLYSDVMNVNDRDSFVNSFSDSSSYEAVAFVRDRGTIGDDNSSDSQNGRNVHMNSKNLVGLGLEGAVQVDVDGMSQDDDLDWSSQKKPSHAVSSNALNLVSEVTVKKADEKPSHVNQSPLKRYSSGKIDKFSDFGQVTQIIGVPPLSASNKDLSSIGKELSLNKQTDPLEHCTINQAVSNSKINYSSGYVLADFSDVQNVAKLQEQSLRMSFSTPLVSKEVSLKVASNKKLNEVVSSSSSKSRNQPAQTGVLRGAGRPSGKTTNPLFTSNNIRQHKNTSEPFQKSLPNLTRKLQPASSSGRPQRSMLPQNGPPVRTASQPAVASQLKPMQRLPPQRTTSTQLKPQGMSLNQRSVNRTSVRAPPTSLMTSRTGPSSRQPTTTTSSRQPLQGTNRQPLSSTRQPSSTFSRQPVSSTTLSRQPLTTSNTTRQPLTTTNRTSMSGSRLASNTTARGLANTSRITSGTRTPLDAPPIRNAAATSHERNSAVIATRNPVSMSARNNQFSSSQRSNLVPSNNNNNNNNRTLNNNNTSLLRGVAASSSSPRNNPRSSNVATTTRSRPVSNLNNNINNNNNTSFAGRLNLPSSSSLLRKPPSNSKPAPSSSSTSGRTAPSLRSSTPRDANNSTLSKVRLAKPSARNPPNRRDNEGDNEDWKYGCF